MVLTQDAFWQNSGVLACAVTNRPLMCLDTLICWVVIMMRATTAGDVETAGTHTAGRALKHSVGAGEVAMGKAAFLHHGSWNGAKDAFHTRKQSCQRVVLQAEDGLLGKAKAMSVHDVAQHWTGSW